MEEGDVEAIQKGNTDCVYFLASPLTCKNGIECEYRHSEIARLNPRDCWFWLSGNCLNPTCAFRHPPLEKHAEAPSELVSFPYQSSIPGMKTDIPCYFFFSGFCNKGDSCSFLHGPVGKNIPAGKSVNTSSAITDKLVLDNKSYEGNHPKSARTEAHLSPSETAMKEVANLKLQLKEDAQQSASENTVRQSPSLQNSALQCQESTVLQPVSLLPTEGFTQDISQICTDQSSEEKVDDFGAQEDRLESSPGFDVLVDDKSDNLGHEDDQEYVMGLDRDHREIGSHFMEYDLEETTDYQSPHFDPKLLYGGERDNSVDFVQNALVFDVVGKDSVHSRDGSSGSLSSRKRKYLPMELAVDDRRGVDLRDHLRKRRVVDVCPFARLTRRDNSSRTYDRHRERPPQKNVISPWLHVKLLNGSRTISSQANQHGWLRRLQSNSSKQRIKHRKVARKEFLSSKVPSKPFSRERRNIQPSTMFMGPKTLAQIKEEKKNAEENSDCMGKRNRCSRTQSADFEGPKPLSEILKDKRRVGSVVDCKPEP